MKKLNYLFLAGLLATGIASASRPPRTTTTFKNELSKEIEIYIVPDHLNPVFPFPKFIIPANSKRSFNTDYLRNVSEVHINVKPRSFYFDTALIRNGKFRITNISTHTEHNTPYVKLDVLNPDENLIVNADLDKIDYLNR